MLFFEKGLTVSDGALERKAKASDNEVAPNGPANGAGRTKMANVSGNMERFMDSLAEQGLDREFEKLFDASQEDFWDNKYDDAPAVSIVRTIESIEDRKEDMDSEEEHLADMLIIELENLLKKEIRKSLDESIEECAEELKNKLNLDSGNWTIETVSYGYSRGEWTGGDLQRKVPLSDDLSDDIRKALVPLVMDMEIGSRESANYHIGKMISNGRVELVRENEDDSCGDLKAIVYVQNVIRSIRPISCFTKVFGLDMFRVDMGDINPD